MRKIGKDKREQMLTDLVAARQDVVALAQRHKVTLEALSDWAAHDEGVTALEGLCRLAYLQTQVLLSRYRLLAAGRLIKLATLEADDTRSKDLARRACVDLLRLDLKPGLRSVDDGSSDDEAGQDLWQLLGRQNVISPGERAVDADGPFGGEGS
ncbi:MAG: hypothetical protein GC164_02715 [Phycisphaera sp.]|nr:hypothetical protein [Phycisphaera sp.]